MSIDIDDSKKKEERTQILYKFTAGTIITYLVAYIIPTLTYPSIAAVYDSTLSSIAGFFINLVSGKGVFAALHTVPYVLAAAGILTAAVIALRALYNIGNNAADLFNEKSPFIFVRWLYATSDWVKNRQHPNACADISLKGVAGFFAIGITIALAALHLIYSVVVGAFQTIASYFLNLGKELFGVEGSRYIESGIRKEPLTKTNFAIKGLARLSFAVASPFTAAFDTANGENHLDYSKIPESNDPE